MFNSQFTVHNAQFVMLNAQFTMHNSQFVIHNLQFTVHILHFTMHSSQFTMNILIYIFRKAGGFSSLIVHCELIIVNCYFLHIYKELSKKGLRISGLKSVSSRPFSFIYVNQQYTCIILFCFSLKFTSSSSSFPVSYPALLLSSSYDYKSIAHKAYYLFYKLHLFPLKYRIYFLNLLYYLFLYNLYFRYLILFF